MGFLPNTCGRCNADFDNFYFLFQPYILCSRWNELLFSCFSADIQALYRALLFQTRCVKADTFQSFSEIYFLFLKSCQTGPVQSSCWQKHPKVRFFSPLTLLIWSNEWLPGFSRSWRAGKRVKHAGLWSSRNRIGHYWLSSFNYLWLWALVINY